MAYKSFYRTYRPAVFDEVVGQEHIVQTLKNALRTDRITHAYLFCGPRGTGKTTIAKLLAKAVNCLATENVPCGQCANCLAISQGTFPDVIEIDAASNNGVDEIRDLIEKVKYAPLEGKYKVYIIDEVHMLSQGAFNALLKTLEEPPEHVIFILATTEAHKVLPTIISRCQRFDFKRVTSSALEQHLDHVLLEEKIKAEPGVTALVAQLSEGGVRDALTILEQCVAYSGDILTLNDVYTVYGVTTPAQRYELIEDIAQGDIKVTLAFSRQLNDANVDMKRFVRDLVEILKDGLVFYYSKDETFLNPSDVAVVQKLCQNFSQRDLTALIDLFVDVLEKSRYSQNTQTFFELALIKGSQLDFVSRPSEPERNVVPAQSKPKPEIVATTAETETLPDMKPDTEDITSEGPDLTIPGEIIEVAGIDDLELVAYMLSADKENKQQDLEAYSRLSDYYTDERWMKVSNLLKTAQIVLSGEHFVFVAVSHPSRLQQFRDPDLAGDLIEFSQQLFSHPKQIFAISDEQFQKTVQLFRNLSSTHQLPQPKRVQPPHIEKKAADQTVDATLFELYGDDVEVIK